MFFYPDQHNMKKYVRQLYYNVENKDYDED
jgi:hypothetical protein